MLAATLIAAVICGCARQPSVALTPGARSSAFGSIQIAVREETRLTEGVGGASVALVPASKEDWRAPLRVIAADTSGRATLSNLPPQRYTVRVWAAGHDTITERISVAAGKVYLVRVKLRDDHCTPLLTAHGPVCM